MDNMRKLMCPKCSRTLMQIEFGKLEIKCPRCGEIIKVTIDKVKSTDERRMSS